MFHGWQPWAESCSEEKMLEYAKLHPDTNWGIYCGGSNLLVVDVDTKKGAPGKMTVNQLAANGNTLPQTLKVETPADENGERGYHLYYVGAARSSVGERGLGEGIDTRGDGCYVVSPGSYLADRQGWYEVAVDVDPIPYPSWIPSMLHKRDSTGLERPDDSDIPGSIKCGERDNELTRWAGMLRGSGLSYEEMRAALHVINETRCEEPLDVDDIERIAASIGSKPRGDALKHAKAIEAFAAVKAESDSRGDDFPIPLDQLPRVSQEERDKDCWIIPDLLVKGHVVGLYGTGGVGKSLIAVQLGMCVAAGIPFCGQKVVAQMPVVYLGCEDEAIETNFRITQVRESEEYRRATFGKTNIPFYSWVRDGMDSVIAKPGYGGDLVAGAFLQLLEDRLSKLPIGPKMLILDNVSDIFLGDENIRVQVNRFCKYILGDLRKKFDLTIVLLAHPSRAGAIDQMSGSTAWQSAVRSRLAMVQDEDEVIEHRILRVMKTNRGTPDFEVPVRWEAWRYRERIKVESRLPRIRLLAEALDRMTFSDEGIQIKDVADMMVSNHTYREYFVDIMPTTGKDPGERAMERLLRADLQGEVKGEGTQYKYEPREGRAKHWCVRTTVKEQESWS